MADRIQLPVHTMLIGIGSRARQGKDTIAMRLHAHWPANSRIYKFADALKVYARVSGLMAEKDPEVLQGLGTLYRRRDPNFWIKMLVLELADESSPIAIISDLRYRNEREFVNQAGGLTIAAIRLNADGTRWYSADRNPNHPSETELDDITLFDYVIRAKSGDLAELAASTDRLASLIEARLKSRYEEAQAYERPTRRDERPSEAQLPPGPVDQTKAR